MKLKFLLYNSQISAKQFSDLEKYIDNHFHYCYAYQISQYVVGFGTNSDTKGVLPLPMVENWLSIFAWFSLNILHSFSNPGKILCVFMVLETWLLKFYLFLFIEKSFEKLNYFLSTESSNSFFNGNITLARSPPNVLLGLKDCMDGEESSSSHFLLNLAKLSFLSKTGLVGMGPKESTNICSSL